MKAFNKKIIAVAGFVVGGPVGAAAAYGAATAAEKFLKTDENEPTMTEAQVAYLFSCLGKVAIADGELGEAEIENLEEKLANLEFDEEGKDMAVSYFKRSVDESVQSIEFYSKKFHEEVGGDHFKLEWLIHNLVALALADGVLCASEETVIRQAIKSIKLPADFFEQSIENAKIQNLLQSHPVEGFGSGFFITPNGYIITNQHVVEDAHSVLVRSIDGIFKAKVIKVDANEDLCLLKIDCLDHPCVSINTSPASFGQDVFTLGFPSPEELGYSIKLTKGCVSATRGENDDARFLQIDATIQGGNSGGPLFCKDSGSLLGVNTAGMDVKEFQNVNYAIKAERLDYFLEEHPSVWKLINTSTSEVAVDSNQRYQLAEQSVVQVFSCGPDGMPWLEDISFAVREETSNAVKGPPELPKNIWVARGGQKYGPYARDAVIQFLESGQLRNEDPAWREGMDEWETLGQLLQDNS